MNRNKTQETDEKYLRMIIACPKDHYISTILVECDKLGHFFYTKKTLNKYFPYLLHDSKCYKFTVVVYKIIRFVCCSVRYLNIPTVWRPSINCPYEPILDIKT